MALLIGIGTGVGMIVLALGNSGEEAPAELPKVPVMIADENLGTGAGLGTGDFTWEDWPAELVPRHAIRKGDEIVDNLENMRLRRSVLEGEPIFPSMLVSKDKDAGFLAATLEPNQRAISIPVSVTTSAGGFVRPGDFVDVLMTYSVRIEGDREDRQAAQTVVARHASETVLERIRILAVDQVVTDSRDAAPARSVTVAVTQEQAEKLTLAQQMGDLSLSLRALSADQVLDAGRPDSQKFTSDIGIAKALQAATQAARLNALAEAGGEDYVSAGTGPSVRVYHGSSVQRVRLTN
ncbi:MAG: Flp pilus assembly protein CpaB [Alphaproteobacteria bacterium]|nr:Flp pilus assembly protein CpaB [Alphaproteobacteria bacterium SS10]